MASGEIGFETDTNKLKIGDGVNIWANLSYFIDETNLSASLGDYVELSSVGVADGVASLDVNGFVPAAQLNIDVSGDIDSAISALVASAPGTLDTLNELAAALGDDANFATTVTNAMASLIPKSTVTTSQDLIVADGASSVTRLGIGADNTVLKVVDGSISWADSSSNNFVISMDGGTNNTTTFDLPKAAGPYSIAFATPDTTFDVYLLDAFGNILGYSGSASIVADEPFVTVVVLGISETQVATFLYTGSVSVPSSAGETIKAGAYLTSATPTDLPTIDDTTALVGGNFATDVEIYFESEGYSEQAKNLVRTNEKQLVVTRPDNLIEDYAPYTIRAENPGIQQPTSSGANLISGITAGTDPTWITSSPLNIAAPNAAFSQTLEASDALGSIASYVVHSGSLLSGLSLDSATGVLSGSPSAGSATFVVRVTDDGGNFTDKEFEHSAIFAQGGVETDSGGYRYHTFTTAGTLEVFGSVSAEYLVIAGGGGGGAASSGSISTYRSGSGGGGAGGCLLGTTTLSVGNQAITIGAGGGVQTQGSNSVFVVTATGGGLGNQGDLGGDGGSGGGGGGKYNDNSNTTGGSGIAGQGFDGAAGTGAAPYGGINQYQTGGGGGGANSAASGKTGGSGITTVTDWAIATSTGVSDGYAGGGGGGDGFFGGNGNRGGGQGHSGNSNTGTATEGFINTGSGGGGGGQGTTSGGTGKQGGSGIVIVRYAI